MPTSLVMRVTLISTVLIMSWSYGCKPMNPNDVGALYGNLASGMALSGEHKTFSTTFDPNPRYACGYLKELVDEFTAQPGKSVPSDGLFFVALSADSYQPSLCGRLIDITVHAQCGNGSAIDEGYCVPEAAKIEKKIQAILVDRCADGKKCTAPSRQNAQIGHDVAMHIDLAPAAKARQVLGDKANYDITWSFSGESYPARAYIVGNDNKDYIRIGLMMAEGVQKIKINGSEYGANGTQAEFGFYSPGIRDKLKAGLNVEVTHQTGAVRTYAIQSAFDESSALKAQNEVIYRAKVNGGSAGVSTTGATAGQTQVAPVITGTAAQGSAGSGGGDGLSCAGNQYCNNGWGWLKENEGGCSASTPGWKGNGCSCHCAAGGSQGGEVYPDCNGNQYCNNGWGWLKQGESGCAAGSAGWKGNGCSCRCTSSGSAR